MTKTADVSSRKTQDTTHSTLQQCREGTKFNSKAQTASSSLPGK